MAYPNWLLPTPCDWRYCLNASLHVEPDTYTFVTCGDVVGVAKRNCDGPSAASLMRTSSILPSNQSVLLPLKKPRPTSQVALLSYSPPETSTDPWKTYPPGTVVSSR